MLHSIIAQVPGVITTKEVIGVALSFFALCLFIWGIYAAFSNKKDKSEADKEKCEIEKKIESDREVFELKLKEKVSRREFDLAYMEVAANIKRLDRDNNRLKSEFVDKVDGLDKKFDNLQTTIINILGK